MIKDIKVRIRGLRKSFSGQRILDGVDLDVPSGANLVLFGASASGKTVLFKCVLGLHDPDEGSVEVDGRETVGLSAGGREAFFRQIGVLFQNGALFDSLPVWQNVSFAMINGRAGDVSVARKAALAALSEVGLQPDTAELLPAELSGGMQKRVALARAIVGAPDLLFLDNPTAGLDPIVTAHIDRLILSLRRSRNATAMTITHDIASARRVGDRAAFLADGRIIWEGPIADLGRAGDPRVVQYVRAGIGPQLG
jgi:phospholipid/cholesterol/gamma-HCH transport system ATP-binding protein